MRASRWREFFEGALPESRVVTPATRHTPTRSLGGAETGRSAMNGNDGPFACAACKLVFEHQNAAAHSKQCKLTGCTLVGGVRYGVDARRRRVLLASPASRRTLGRTTPAACAARAPCRSASGSTRLWSPRARVALDVGTTASSAPPPASRAWRSADAAFSTCSERTWCGART